jgi:hypothetical protein
VAVDTLQTIAHLRKHKCSFAKRCQARTPPFSWLMRVGQDDLAGDSQPASPQIREVDPARYRMNRKLSLAERAKLAEEYRFGLSVLELARRYKMHRRTVARTVGAGRCCRSSSEEDDPVPRR